MSTLFAASAATVPPSSANKRGGFSNTLSNLGVNYGKRHSQANQMEKKMEINDEGGKPATMLYRGDDGEMREYEIVETHEHESVFQKACPVLPIAIALICAILNLCPGLGTAIGALCQVCCNRAKPDPEGEGKQLIAGCPCKKMFTGLGTAFLQLLLAPLIFGWIWSIQYGALMVRKANDRKHENEQSNP